MSNKVFVGGLNYDTDQQKLESLFAQAGEVLSVHVPIDRDTGRSRGVAFVEFASAAEATAAIDRLDGYELDGKHLRVNVAEDRQKSRPSFEGDRGGQGGRPGGGAGKPKGSRRNIRRKKRSL